MAGEWRFNPSVHWAKGDRSVRARALPVSDNELHVAWFDGRDVTKHTAQGNIAWFIGSDVRTSSNFA